jgi:hypothetical protein
MRTILFCILFILASTINATAQNKSHLKLWDTSPAKQWVEALPVGNIMQVAMV